LYRWPGDEEVVRTLLYPVELHPPFQCRVNDRIRTDNRCMPTGSRRGQVFQTTQRSGAESPALLPQSPESVLRRTAVGTRSSSRRDLEGCHYLGRPRIATLGPLMYSQPAVGSWFQNPPPSRMGEKAQRSLFESFSAGARTRWIRDRSDAWTPKPQLGKRQPTK